MHLGLFSIRKGAPAALLALAMLSAPAMADVKDGVDAWTRGDYTAAVKEWKGPAEKGDADAQFNLAQAYRMGRGVRQDMAKAEELYGLAAQRGHLQAADNYGLLLFQRGDRSRAMPYIQAAADRGEPRAQYVLGLSYFNGENVPKDWVRAYALVSLARQAGVAQAANALKEMDQHIPIEDRQKSVPLATSLAAKAEATRALQIASADLGVGEAIPPRPGSVRPFENTDPTLASAQDAVASAARAAGTSSPATAGADYTRGVPPLATIMRESKPAAKPRGKEAPASASSRTQPRAAPATPPAARSAGAWRVQLGAFGVAGNAEKLWSRVSGRPELAGRSKMLTPAGRLTKVQAGGFASQDEAQAACAKLKAGGFSCIVTRD